MRLNEPGLGESEGPLAALRKIIPFEAAASSDGLSWAGLEAARYCAAPASELNPPALTYHRLVLFSRPPESLDLTFDGVNRFKPPLAGAISLVPAGSPVRWRWSGRFDWLHVFLDAQLVGRVAAESFELDPARLEVPPLDGIDLPQIRTVMAAVDAELTAGGAGGSLAAESLANLLAVNVVRQVLSPSRPARGPDGALPRARPRAVVDYIEDHLSASPSLDQMAAIACLSPYHFARQFKAATGLPPHQYAVMRRVERAKQLLETGSHGSLAEVAMRAGFSDQSQFSRHFKRFVGVTPGQFRHPQDSPNRRKYQQDASVPAPYH
jgi:AraC family transcriptional regulator